MNAEPFLSPAQCSPVGAWSGGEQAVGEREDVVALLCLVGFCDPS